MADKTFTNPLLAQKASDDFGSAGAMAFYVRKALSNMDVCLPAKVLAYDRARNVATVKPLINRVTADKSVFERSSIFEVQCLSIGAGGFHLSFPIKKDDLGWIIAADRDISIFKQSLKEEKPNTARNHSFADCWFVTDMFRNYTINGEDGACAVFQSTDGTQRVVIANNQVRIVSGASRIVVTGGSVTVTTNSATIDAPNTTITGNTSIGGNLSVTGTISSPNAATLGGISTTGHHHVDGDGENTGGALA